MNNITGGKIIAWFRFICLVTVFVCSYCTIVNLISTNHYLKATHNLILARMATGEQRDSLRFESYYEQKRGKYINSLSPTSWFNKRK